MRKSGSFLCDFTIITPTLVRSSLIDTCRSIDRQEYEGVEHLVLIDVAPTNDDMQIIKECQSEHRHFIIYNPDGPSGYPGSELRHYAWQFAHGDYVLYIDDDDLYINQTFLTIKNAINKASMKPLWGMFPAERLGRRFFYPETIQGGLISGVQFFHARVFHGRPVMWPQQNVGMDDWQFIEGLNSAAAPLVINGGPLVRITQIGGGHK